MNEFKSLEAADALIAHITGEPLEVGRALALARDGKVNISFFCNDRIGYFPLTGDFTSAAEKTNDVRQYVGFLTSVARPRLNVRSEKWTEDGSEVTLHNSLIVVDVMPDQVKMPHKPGFFIALVRTWIDENSNIRSDNGLDMRPIPQSEWHIGSDELRAVFAPATAATNSDLESTVKVAQTDAVARDKQAPAAKKSAQVGSALPPRNTPAWKLINTPSRMPGYRAPLYRFLQDAHIAGKPCPKAQQVLDAWKSAQPQGVSVIQKGKRDCLVYTLDAGDTKTADLKAIQATITALIASK